MCPFVPVQTWPSRMLLPEVPIDDLYCGHLRARQWTKSPAFLLKKIMQILVRPSPLIWRCIFSPLSLSLLFFFYFYLFLVLTIVKFVLFKQAQLMINTGVLRRTHQNELFTQLGHVNGHRSTYTQTRAAHYN